jgi:hypothetical protein
MCVSCVCCVGSGLCDGLITLSQESYRVCVFVCVCVCVCVWVWVCVCLIVLDLENLTMRRIRPDVGCCATEKFFISIIILSLIYQEKRGTKPLIST